MRIKVIVVEDSNLGQVVEEAVAAAANLFNLPALGVELEAHPFTQVTDIETLKTLGNALADCQGVDGRVVIVDMELHGAGCPISDIVKFHDTVVPEPLRTHNDRDRHIAGGKIATWMALQSQTPRQLIVYATEAANAGRLHTMAQVFRANGHPELCYDLLDGGLDPQETRVLRIVSAVGKWLERYGSPRARLWPETNSSWFVDNSPNTVVPHIFRRPTAAYFDAVKNYLGGSLQIPSRSIEAHINSLSCAEQLSLHDYLKGFVGSHAAAHVMVGYRLRWNHLPFLAAACAPAPGQWIFDNALLHRCNSDILNPIHHDKEQGLIDYLVGAANNASTGLFQEILTDSKEQTKSNLLQCVWTESSFVMSLNFNISERVDGRESLFAKFERAKVNDKAPGGSTANALFNAWKFLQTAGLVLSLNQKDSSLYIKRQ